MGSATEIDVPSFNHARYAVDNLLSVFYPTPGKKMPVGGGTRDEQPDDILGMTEDGGSGLIHGVVLPSPIRYRGMSYTQASREADYRIPRWGWYLAWPSLVVLQEIRGMRKSAVGHMERAA